MKIYECLYIDGEWRKSIGTGRIDVINPATGELAGSVPSAGLDDCDAAIEAAARAFPQWAATPAEQRLAYLEKLVQALQADQEELAQIICAELGAPIGWSRAVQVGLPIGVLANTIEAGREFFRRPLQKIGNSEIHHEPVGVCSLIAPWNYPLHQAVAKMAPALVAGCTVILKPSSETPLSSFRFAELIHATGLPAGVFNLLSGPGRTIGERMSSHPLVDMVSITGSTEAGARIAQLAAPSIKRVCQELGGKSANILLDDAPLAQAVPATVMSLMANTGQTCAALTRLIVPRARQNEVIELARAAAATVVVGDPLDSNTYMGPMVSTAQQKTVLDYIGKGIEEGARLIAGGMEPPRGLERGAFVQPTIFADVRNDMTIAREEIFGPVLAIVPVDSEEEAIAVANDSPFGLSGAVWSADRERARQVALRLRTGQVFINDAQFNLAAPFGGYKQSGNGRELGPQGLHEFLEIKALNL